MKLSSCHIRLIKLLTFWILLPLVGLGQPFQDKLPGDLINHLVDISPQASDIEVDNEGNIYLLDQGTQIIYKYLSSAKYDSSLSIGGLGNRENGFLEVQKIKLPNRQQLYVLDNALQEVAILNPDLKISRRLPFRQQNNIFNNEAPIQARSFSIGQSGDIFLLNELDNKIYIYNVFGELVQNFGGNDYGPGSLFAPKDIWANYQNLLFVSEEQTNQVKVFDNQGTFQYTIQVLCKKPTFLILEENYLICANSNNLVFQHVETGAQSNFTLKSGQEIYDIELTKELIYLLCNSGLYIYSRN